MQSSEEYKVFASWSLHSIEERLLLPIYLPTYMHTYTHPFIYKQTNTYIKYMLDGIRWYGQNRKVLKE